MEGIKNWWNNFAERHPGTAKWIREGGLFVIVSNLITVMKYFILLFLPYAFADLAGVDFGWPGIGVNLFGVDFDWNIFGYAVKYEAGQVVVGGGLGYFIAYMIAMGIGEIINFPIQKNFVFRSKGQSWQADRVVCHRLYRHQLRCQLHQLRVGGGGWAVCPRLAL